MTCPVFRTTVSLRRRPLVAPCSPFGADCATGRGAEAPVPQRPGPLHDGKLRLLVEPRTRSAREIAEARLRADFVVMAAPALDDRLGLRPRPEPFEAQALVAELAVEAFGDAILPRLAGLDQRRIDALRNDPGQERLRHELRAVVAAQEDRCTALAHQARQHLDHPRRADAAVDIDR